MTKKVKNAGSFETINPDRREAVRESLENKIETKNVKSFLEGEYKGKRGEVVREIADELGLGRTTVQSHIKTLELSENHGWILEMADGNIPTIVKALKKAPSDRTELEKDAIEEKIQKKSEEVPSVVEESTILYYPMKEDEPDALPFSSTVKLARELDRLAELPLQEQVTFVLEVAQFGKKQIRNSLWFVEEEREMTKNESDDRDRITEHRTTLSLDDEHYGLLKEYADDRDITVPEAAADIIIRSLDEGVRGTSTQIR